MGLISPGIKDPGLIDQHQGSGNQSGQQGSGNQSGHQGSGNQGFGNGSPRQDGNHKTDGRFGNRTKDGRRNERVGNKADKNNYNRDLAKHFAKLLKGKIPPGLQVKLMNGETFEYSNWRSDKELESTVLDIMKRKALIALMGKNGCSICVLIIQGNPNSYKAVFPHFIVYYSIADVFHPSIFGPTWEPLPFFKPILN